MSDMTCARFESLLAEALAGGDAASRQLVPELKRHAASCPACAGSLDLVEMAEAAPHDRDPVAEPPAGYWETFEPRLLDRLERGRRRRAALGGIAAAAAAAGIALVVVRGPFRSETARVVPPLDPGGIEADDPFEPFPAPGAIGAFSEGEGGALFPGVDDLSVEEQRRLIESLRDEEARIAGGEA